MVLIANTGMAGTPILSRSLGALEGALEANPRRSSGALASLAVAGAPGPGASSVSGDCMAPSSRVFKVSKIGSLKKTFFRDSYPFLRPLREHDRKR